MSDIKKAREMLRKAENDYRAVQELETNERIADEIFGFLAQQAIEKALKAWLAARGKKYPGTHDISLLLLELKKDGVDVDRFEDLIELNPFAVQFRYETMGAEEPALDRHFVTTQVGEILETILKVFLEFTKD